MFRQLEPAGGFAALNPKNMSDLQGAGQKRVARCQPGEFDEVNRAGLSTD
jgi:hypothetical protein